MELQKIHYSHLLDLIDLSRLTLNLDSTRFPLWLSIRPSRPRRCVWHILNPNLSFYRGATRLFEAKRASVAVLLGTATTWTLRLLGLSSTSVDERPMQR